jgi:hypothetical protein
MIAGNHFDSNAGLPALPDRFQGFRPWRINDAEQPQQCESTLHIPEAQLSMFVIGRSKCHGQHALTSTRYLLNPVMPRPDIQRTILSQSSLKRAHLQHPFRGTLDKHKSMTGMVMM